MQTTPHRVALYARVSTDSQSTENQLLELRAYCAARGWSIRQEFIDDGISGAKTSRPGLDAMMIAARRRQIDAVVVWKLDRLGRSLGHLVTLLDELTSLGVAFVSLGEAIDMTTPAGRLQAHILSAMAEFERARIKERVHAGIARARQQGKRLGRRRSTPLPSDAPKGLTVREAARLWGCSPAQASRRLNKGLLPPTASAA